MGQVSLQTRKPTGAVPYPVILLEGEEKAGKTWAAAVLSGSDKVGQTYWLDLGEGSADEYGAIPGANYLVIEHDGSYGQILDAITEVREIAKAQHVGQCKPVVLVIDSMSALWEGLKDWTTSRAVERARKKGKSTATEDLRITTDLWNDAGARYRRVMTLLLTFPGIVVLTARGKEVAVMGAGGQPVEGKKEHKVEGHKSLAFDCSVWVRMFRTSPPLVIGARSVHTGIVPGKDDPQPIDGHADDLLKWLIFDALRVTVRDAAVRDLKDVSGGELTDDERAAEEGKEPSARPRPQRAAPDQWTEARQPYDPEAADQWLAALDLATSLEALRLAGDALSAMKRTGRINDDEFAVCAEAGKRRKTELEADAAMTDDAKKAS